MCGIFCSLSNINYIQRTKKSSAIDDKIKKYLGRRGPDVIYELNRELNTGWDGYFLGSVLWTQGSNPTPQPLEDGEGNVLLWNGDVLHGRLACDQLCDSKVVLEKFRESVLSAVVEIYGPYSFVYWNMQSRQLWFGRDVFGRQSLLWDVSSDHLALTSVAHKDSLFSEVPALGIYMVDLSFNMQVEIQFFPWTHLTTEFTSLSNVPVMIQEQVVHCQVGDGSSRSSWSDLEPTESELRWYDCPTDMQSLLTIDQIVSRTDSLLDVLLAAVECRVQRQPSVCQDCTCVCDHCSVAVCFSGGLDSTLLALLADRYVPSSSPIDLYNVAFQQPSGSFDVPDRITGMSSLEELKQLAPHRTWNFVKIDVGRQELDEERSHRLADLIFPLSSVLDDSIGCALWFAVRGQGHLDGQLYTSPARVVLLGMGADEQLGGYTRHRNTLRHSGRWAVLGQELSADTDNIARRNLGRDNRVCSDLGRQPRLPFLDERVVTHVNSLPPWHRCIPTRDWPPGIGDKLLLRLVAYRMGLRGAARLPKRALQFGSRIANRKEKGDNVSERL